MLARLTRWREWRVVIVAVLALTLAGCGNVKDLLKDTPAPEEQQSQ